MIVDAANQPIILSGDATGSYSYDGNYRRVKGEVDGETIYNIYDSSGTLVHVDNITTNRFYDYVRAGSMALARFKSHSGANGITYLHNDHLGSAVAGSDAVNGDILWQETFLPYGETLNNPAANDNQV